MKQTWLFALVLALCLTMLFPAAVSADPVAFYEGSCGAHTWWEFTEKDNTLRIFGSGAIDDIESGSPPPWDMISQQIYHVVVDEGITHIGANAFRGLLLRTVSLPSTLTSIGTSAFMFSSLPSIVIPDSVTQIGDIAFAYCNSLETITLPKNLEIVGQNAFTGVPLQEVHFFENITQISSQAFYGCTKLQSVTFTADAPKIDRYAFQGTHITIIYPADNATWQSVIEQNLYGSITWQPSRDMGSSGTFGDDTVFTWRVDANTLYITGDGSMIGSHWEDIKNPPWYHFRDTVEKVVFSDGVSDIYSYCLKDFTKLKTIEWSKNIVCIFDHAFENCTSLVSVDIPDSVTELHDYAFSGCTSLTTVKLPEGLRDLYSNAFQGCTALSSLSPLPEKLEMIGNCAFESTAIQEIVIPERVGTLGGSIFKDCSQLERVVIKSSCPTIESNMFRGCSSLKTVYFSKAVQQILDQAFADCSSLESIYFLGNMPAFAQQTDHNSYGFACTVYYPEDNPSWNSGSIQNLQSRLRGSELDFIGAPVHYCMDKHNELIYAAVAPTCLETGLTEGRYCFVCENTLVKQETIPATGHTFGDWQEVEAATTEKDGLAERACEVCGLIEYKILDKLVPPSTEPTVPPTVAPTEPTQAATQPTIAPTDPTQPNITTEEEPQSFHWVIVVIAVAAVAAAAAGFLLAKKKK